MKKTLIILLFNTTILIFAVSGYVQLSGFPYWSSGINKEGVYEQIFETEIYLQETAYGITVYCNNQTKMLKGSACYFAPFNTTHTAGLKYSFKALTIGAEHQCSHPVEVNGYKPFKLESSYNKIYVRYDFGN